MRLPSHICADGEQGDVGDNWAMNTTLSLRHFLLALAVVAVWGSNFVVIKLALEQLPPLLLAALRFLVVVLPMVFVLPRPAVSWRNLAAYG